MFNKFLNSLTKKTATVDELLGDPKKSELTEIYQAVKRLGEIPTEESAQAVITLAREVLSRYDSKMKPFAERAAHSMLVTGMNLHSRPGPPPTIDQFRAEATKQIPSALSELGKQPDKPDFQPFAAALLQIGEKAVSPTAELCEASSGELKEMGNGVIKKFNPEMIIRALPSLRVSSSFRTWLTLGIRTDDPEQQIHLQIARGEWASVKASVGGINEEMGKLYLHHDDPIVRANILDLLATANRPLAAQACREALLSERAEVQAIAVRHAPDLLGDECRDILVGFLTSGDQKVRLLAAESLSHFGSEVAEIFKQAFTSSDWKARQAAVHVLPKWAGDGFNQFLEQARKDPVPLVRDEAYKVS